MNSFHNESVSRLPEFIKEGDRVLDVGGWHAPLNRADYVLDIMPYETRNQSGAILKEEWPEERFSKKTFLQTDICASRPWPFPDKFFDFVFCSHTIEDVRDPLKVCEEILRVGKAGFIEVPSRIVESTKGVERPFYCGYYHHRWLCETQGTHINFLFKPAMLHAYSKFNLKRPFLKKINPAYASVGFFWRGHFSFKEQIIIDRDEVQANLSTFKSFARNLPKLFVPKYDLLGRRT